MAARGIHGSQSVPSLSEFVGTRAGGNLSNMRIAHGGVLGLRVIALCLRQFVQALLEHAEGVRQIRVLTAQRYGLHILPFRGGIVAGMLVS
jgi:hypothetical protein